MPVPRGTSQTITYTAWNFSTNQGQIADAGNHLLRIVRDGVELLASGIPIEIDGSNTPGEYSLVLSTAEMDGRIITVIGKSNTPNVSIIPTTLTTD